MVLHIIKKLTKKIKALIIVHVWGNACKIEKLAPLLKKEYKINRGCIRSFRDEIFKW